MPRKLIFQIKDGRYDHLQSWQEKVKAEIRTQNLETQLAHGEYRISNREFEMLRSGEASVHWGYCREPWTFTFSPKLPKPQGIKESEFIYILVGDRPVIEVKVRNNVTGEELHLDPTVDVNSQKDQSSWSIRSILMEWIRYIRIRIFGLPLQSLPIELVAGDAGSYERD